MFEAVLSAFISLITITALNPLIRIAKENAIIGGADAFKVDQFWLIFNVVLTLGMFMLVYFGIEVYKAVNYKK